MATAKRPKRGRAVANKAGGDKQIDLPFVQEHLSLGIFGNASATIHNGENLDIPTTFDCHTTFFCDSALVSCL